MAPCIVFGQRLGVIGATGGGKSTLIDIFMGLLEPTAGFLKVDGKAITKKNVRGWQRRIAHVPQVIFLSDTTIAENIAFGIDKKDIETINNKIEEFRKKQSQGDRKRAG